MQYAQWHFVAIQYSMPHAGLLHGGKHTTCMSKSVACSDRVCSDYGRDIVDLTLASLVHNWSQSWGPENIQDR